MSDVNQIEISADGQDLTITIGDYSNADARQAISVTDSGGDGSLAYNNTSGVITYTGPSASEVRAHFTAGAGISIASGVITNTSLNTNTTYTVSAEDGTAGKKIIRLTGSDAYTDDVTLVQGSNVTLTRAGDEITIASSYTDTNTTYTQGVTSTTGGANLNLVGTDSTTDPVKFASGTNVTVTRTDDSTITIASTDTNTTYGISAETATGGANLRLTGTDSNTDNVKFASGTGITVSRTDADTINIATTITQYTDTLARQAISVATNTGDGDLTYNNTNGQFSYTGPGTTEYRAAIGVSNASGDGSLAYSTSTGVITYTGPTNSNYRGAVSAANSGTGYGTLSYDTPTGVFTFAKVTGANIRSEVVDGRNLTYTGGGSTLDLDKALGSVNSVTAESATNLTLTGDELVLTTRDNTGTSPTITVTSQGYIGNLNYNLPTFVDPITVGGTSTTALPQYVIFFDAVTGTNTLTNVEIYDSYNDPTLSTLLDWTALPVSAMGLAFTEDFQSVPFGGALHGAIFPRGTTITNIAPVSGSGNTIATVTLSNNALADVTLYDDIATLNHLAYNSTNDLWAVIDGYNAGTSLYTSTVVNALGTNGTSNYVDYSQLLATQFTATFTVNPVIRWNPRKVTELKPANTANDHLRVPFGLGVGPGSIMTNRGMLRDGFDAIGININNNGKLTGFNGKTGLNLTQFKNNSFFESGTPAERCGPNFTFNSFAGNEDTANASLYLTSGDGIGQITWFAQPQFATLQSSTYTPASITVKATETHTAATPTSISKHGSGMYLQYTPNSQGNSTPRTFLRAEDVTTEVLAKTTIKLGKISTATNSTARNLSATAARTWVTIDDSGLSLNGSTSGSVELAASATGDQLNLLDSASVALVGNKINYNRVYGQWQYNTSITGLTADTAYVFPIGTADFNNIASVGSTSRIILGAAGMYNLQFSVQVANTDNAEHTAYIWLVKNGTPVAASTGRITVVKSGSTIAGWNYLIDSANTTDYYEIGYAVSNSALTFVNYASTAFAPSTATLITTVTPIGA